MKLMPDKVRGFLLKHLGAEGSYRGPAVGWSHWGTPFPVAFGDGFQDGLSLTRTGAANVPVAYACVMALAKAISVCTPVQIEVQDNGARKKSTTSPASRIFRKPNDYQTWGQFILNAVAIMLFHGETFIWIERDDRNAARALHILEPNSATPLVSTDGSVHYEISWNQMLPNRESRVPAREIIHLRQYTPRHPLIGETPITAAMLALGVNVALSGNQAAFFTNMNRPSGVLSTDQVLTRDQMQQLRQAFDDQAKGMNAGKIPVLSAGLKFSTMSISSQDSQLVEAQRMSIEDVARVFGVPLAIIGDPTKSSGGTTESVINFWLATGLGSMLTNLEQSFSAAFNLSPNEIIEFETKNLLRLDYKSRIEGLTKAIQGGVLTPNEARAVESLPPVTDGDKIFLQQQMVPIDLLTELHTTQIAQNNAPAKPAEPAPPEDDEDADEDVARGLVIDMLTRKRA